MRILIVEDDAFINALTSDDLESAGYGVLSAYDADEAIAILENNDDVRLLFTDIDMPGSMNGLSLAAVVHERWPPIHIIITSGMTRPREDEIPEHSIFIPKPWNFAKVLDAVHSFGD